MSRGRRYVEALLLNGMVAWVVLDFVLLVLLLLSAMVIGMLMIFGVDVPKIYGDYVEPFVHQQWVVGILVLQYAWVILGLLYVVVRESMDRPEVEDGDG